MNTAPAILPPWDRRFSFGLLVLLIPLGIITKVYSGVGALWLRGYGGDILYTMAWLALVLLLKPRFSLTKTCLWIFGLTALGECSQLWHPPWLAPFRATLFGQLLLGSAFSWPDFLCYGLGCALGWLFYWAYHRAYHRPRL